MARRPADHDQDRSSTTDRWEPLSVGLTTGRVLSALRWVKA